MSTGLKHNYNFLKQFTSSFALIGVTIISFLIVRMIFPLTLVNATDVCPNTGDGWTKLDYEHETYSAESGFIVDQVCVKGGHEGSTDGGHGYIFTAPTDVVPVNCVKKDKTGSITVTGLNTPTIDIDFTGDACAAVSHASYHLVEDPGDSDEETDPTPTQTPTPTPSLGKQSRIGYNAISCNENFEVVADLTENGNPVEGVEVTFNYNPEAKATTNADGRARVFFPRLFEGPVTAKADGYPTQTVFVTFPTCHEEGETNTSDVVLAAATTNPPRRGQVLGATTLANTGSAAETVAIVAFSAGVFGMMLFGYTYVCTANSKKS